MALIDTLGHLDPQVGETTQYISAQDVKDAFIQTYADVVSAGGGVSDHGLLTGLDDDDHTQYALADGTRGSFATTAQGALADTALQVPGLGIWTVLCISGRWAMTPQHRKGSVTRSVGSEYPVFFVPQEDCVIDRVGVTVVTDAPSNVVRIGLREFDLTTGFPGDLIADYGTVDASVAGNKEIVVNQSLVGNTGYVLTIAPQGTGSVTMAGTVARSGPWTPDAIGSSTDIENVRAQGVSGALPTTATWEVSTSYPPVGWMRFV